MNTHATFKGTAHIVCAAALLVFTSGCASIIHGTTQTIPVGSDPAGASVYVDGELRGVTPLTLRIRRGDPSTDVKIELEGHQPSQRTIFREFSWWYAGNIVFGGLIGLVVDAVDGAMWYQDCDKIFVNLSPDSGVGPRVETSVSRGQVSSPANKTEPESIFTASEPTSAPASVDAGSTPKSSPKPNDALAKLDDMKRRGLISDEEYEQMKSKLE